MTTRLEFCHDEILCGNTMCVLFGREGGLQGGVEVAMVGNHDVLISATRSNWEVPSVVGVELSHMFDMDVQFVGPDGGQDRSDRRAWWSSGDGGLRRSLAAS